VKRKKSDIRNSVRSLRIKKGGKNNKVGVVRQSFKDTSNFYRGARWGREGVRLRSTGASTGIKGRGRGGDTPSSAALGRDGQGRALALAGRSWGVAFRPGSFGPGKSQGRGLRGSGGAKDFRRCRLPPKQKISASGKCRGPQVYQERKPPEPLKRVRKALSCQGSGSTEREANDKIGQQGRTSLSSTSPSYNGKGKERRAKPQMPLRCRQDPREHVCRSSWSRTFSFARSQGQRCPSLLLGQ